MFGAKNQTDPRIIREVLAGKSDRFADLVARYLPSVYATALAHTRNRTDAEDVVQDTFVNAYTALDSLRTPAKFGPWILTIARNVARKHLRKRDAVPAPTPNQTPSPENALQRAELLNLLSGAVDELPESEREVILLHYFSGQSAREIAASLGITRPAVLKRLERGRAHLGEQLLREVGDTKTAKQDLLPSTDRIMQAVLAASAAWQVSKAVGAGGIAAATTAMLPKATTVAACIAGMAFASLLGWAYLSQDSLDAADAIQAEPNPPEAFPVAATDPANAEAAPLVIAAAETDETTEDDPQPAAETDATNPSSVATDAGSTDAEPTYTAIDGLWDFTYHAEELNLTTSIGRAELSGAGGDLTVISAEGVALELIQSVKRAGQQVTLVLAAPDGSGGTLEGEFNEALTVLELDGSLNQTAGQEPATLTVTVIGIRVTEAKLTREQQIEAFKQELLDLYAKLTAYAAAHDGAYPETLAALYPQYEMDQEKLLGNDTRSLTYNPPPALQTMHAAFDPLTVTTAEELLAIEAYLQDTTGDSFGPSAPVLLSEHYALNVRATVNRHGEVNVVQWASFTPEPAGSEAVATAAQQAAQQAAQNASCMNNMKQIGLANKMFEYEQAVDMFAPGFHTLYPNYIADLAILRCPSAEIGTISYELVFPAATAEEMMNFAREIEGLPEAEYDDFFVQARVPFAIERHECSGTNTRNVLFLDGHVTRYNEESWQTEIAPYLEQ